jgi:hypothetical protein
MLVSEFSNLSKYILVSLVFLFRLVKYIRFQRLILLDVLVMLAYGPGITVQ